MSQQQQTSVVSVIIDSIDVTALANNVISHMVKKREPRVDDTKIRRAGGVCTISDLQNEDPGTDTTDGSGTPYEYQRAPSYSQTTTAEDEHGAADVAEGEDAPDFPGMGYRVGVRNSRIRAVTVAMLRVADELDKNEEMWSLFGQLELTPETAYDTFRQVALGIFSRGVSWGKIAVLFMFAAHCVVKAVLSELPNILVMLSSFVAQFFGERLQQWIEAHGGWVSQCACGAFAL